MRLLLSAFALGAVAFFLSRRRTQHAIQDGGPSYNAPGANSTPSQAGAMPANVMHGVDATAQAAEEAAHDVVAQAQNVAAAVDDRTARTGATDDARDDAQAAADHVRKATGQVQDTAGSIVEQIKAVVSDVSGEMKDTAGSVADKVQDAAGSIAGEVKDAGGPITQEVKAAADGVQSQVGAAVDNAKDAAPGVVDGVKDAASTAAAKVQGAVGAAGDNVQEAVGTVSDKAQDAASTAGDKARASVEGAKDAAPGVVDGVKDAVSTVGNQVEDTASTFGDKMRDVRGDRDEIPAAPSSSIVATDVDTPAPSMRETMRAELVDIEQKVDSLRDAMSAPVNPAEGSMQAAGMSGIMDTESLAGRPDTATGPGIPPRSEASPTASTAPAANAAAPAADALPSETVTVDGREKTIGIPTGAATTVPGGGAVDPLSAVPLGTENASSEGDANSTTTGMEHPPLIDRAEEVAGRTSGAFVGNKATRVYRPSDSSNLPGEAKRIYFESEDEAKAAGFRPADHE